MTTSWNDFIDGLSENPESIPTRQPKAKQKFPCQRCGGTGLWEHGRLNRHGNNKCATCQGRGYFLSSPESRASAKQRKITREAQVLSDFVLANEDMVQRLSEIANWNSFAASMLTQLGLAYEDVARRIASIKAGFNFRGGKPLTERQVDACQRMLAKIAQRDEARQQERLKQQVETDLSPIRRMFETAVASGYKKPTYRAEGLVINRAPDTGANPGALYVKNEDGVYLGKILGTTFTPSRDGREAAPILQAIAVDPLQAALRYGQRTGRCSCCGRELTNHTSIDLGIGPVCREKWGL